MKLSVKTGPAKGKTAEVTGDSIVIGRDEGCDFVLGDDEASRRHAEISKSASGGYEVSDLGSRNGTLVNGRPVSAPVALTSGEEIEIGGSIVTVELSFEEGGPDPNATKIASEGDQTKLASVLNPPVLKGKSGPGAGLEVKPSPIGVVVGRDDDCDVTIDDHEASRRHTELKLGSDAMLEVTDLGSANGTFVDGQKISRTVKVRDGSSVKIGGTQFVVSDPNTRSKTEVKPATAAGAAAAGAAASAGVARPAPASAAPGGAPAGASRAGQAAPPRRTAPTSGGKPRRGGDEKEKSKAGLFAVLGLGLAAVVAAVLVFSGVLSSDDDPLTASEIIDQVGPSTVNVLVSDGENEGNGSGFVYNADDGLIVTNAHVVGAGTKFTVGFDNEARNASVVGVAPCSDLALLKANRRAGFETLPFGVQDEISQGDTLFALGFPGNASLESELQVTQGIVSTVDSRVDAAGLANADFALFPNVIQTDAAINPGNSGGPSVNDRGELIGVNTLSSSGENQNYAIGLPEVEEVVPQLAEGNSIGWAGFGLEAIEVGGDTRAVMQIKNVVPGTHAARVRIPFADGSTARLEPGLLVTSVANQRITSAQDYCNAVENVESGETVPLEVNTPRGYVADIPPRRVQITFE